MHFDFKFVTGRPARSAVMPVLRFISLLYGPKMSCSPRKGDTCPDKPVPNITFIGA